MEVPSDLTTIPPYLWPLPSDSEATRPPFPTPGLLGPAPTPLNYAPGLLGPSPWHVPLLPTLASRDALLRRFPQPQGLPTRRPISPPSPPIISVPTPQVKTTTQVTYVACDGTTFFGPKFTERASPALANLIPSHVIHFLDERPRVQFGPNLSFPAPLSDFTPHFTPSTSLPLSPSGWVCPYPEIRSFWAQAQRNSMRLGDAKAFMRGLLHEREEAGHLFTYVPEEDLRYASLEELLQMCPTVGHAIPITRKSLDSGVKATKSHKQRRAAKVTRPKIQDDESWYHPTGVVIEVEKRSTKRCTRRSITHPTKGCVSLSSPPSSPVSKADCLSAVIASPNSFASSLSPSVKEALLKLGSDLSPSDVFFLFTIVSRTVFGSDNPPATLSGLPPPLRTFIEDFLPAIVQGEDGIFSKISKAAADISSSARSATPPSDVQTGTRPKVNVGWRNVPGLVESISSLLSDPSLFDKLGGVAEHLTDISIEHSLSERDREILQQALKMSLQIQAYTSTYKPTRLKFPWLQSLIAFALGVLGICFAPNKAFAFISVILAILGSGIPQAFKNWLEVCRHDIATLDKLHQPQAQGLSDMLAPLSRVIFTGAAYLFSTQDTSSVPAYVKTARFTNSIKSLSSFQELFDSAIKLASDKLWEFETDLPASFRTEEGSLLIDIQTWLQIYRDTLLDSEYLSKVFHSKSHELVVEKLLSTGVDLQQRMAAAKLDFRKWPIVECLQHVRKISHALTASKKPGRTRVEPVFVVLKGRSGIGKTTMCDHLKLRLFERFPKEDRLAVSHYNDLSYTKANDSDYWDGYRNHPFILIDELFAGDATDPSSLVMAEALLSLISCNDAPLNVATCEYKNSVLATPKFVIGTTNLDNWNLIKLTCPEALTRRRHFFVEPRILPQFANANGSLNYESWLQHCQAYNLKPAIPDYAVYQLYDANNRPLGAPISFDQLLDAIWNRYEQHVRVHTAVTSENEQLFEQYRAQAGLDDLTDSFNYSKSERASTSKAINKDSFRNLIVRNFVVTDEDESKIPKWYEELEKKGLLDLAFTRIACLSRLPIFSRLSFVGNLAIDLGDIPFQPNTTTEPEQPPIKNTILSLLSKLKHAISDHPWITALSILGVATTIGISLFAYFRSSPNNTRPDKSQQLVVTRESNPPPKQRFFKQVRRVKYNVQALTEDDPNIDEIYQAHTLDDPVLESMLSKIQRCLARVAVYGSTGCILQRTHGIVVCTDWLLVPGHLFTLSPGWQSISVEYSSYNVRYSSSQLSFNQIGERWNQDDVVLVQFPVGRLPAPDIRRYFIKAKEVPQFEDVPGELMVMRDGAFMRFISHIRPNLQFYEESEAEKGYPCCRMSTSGLELLDGWMYHMPTQAGDCGAPLMRWDSSSPTKIIGIHLACFQPLEPKARARGFSAIVDQDWIYDVTKVAATQGDDYPVTDPSWVTDQIIITERVSRSHHLPPKNPIQPSILAPHLPWKPKTLPTEMGSQNLKLALTKFRTQQPLLDEPLIHQLTTALFYKHCSSTTDPKLLSWDETLNSYGQLESINLKSSAGYPHYLTFSKSDVIKYDDKLCKFVFTDATFRDLLDQWDRALQSSDSPFEVIWACYLKAERLPSEKVSEGKCRLFMASPIDFTLVCRRYFGQFLDYLREVGPNLGCMVGIDPHTEWASLAHKMLSASSQFLFFDWSNWDRSLPVPFMEAFFDFADLYYGTTFQDMRDKIRAYILSPTYIINNLKFKTLGGNPSGCVFTSELNSIANILVNLYIISKLTSPTQALSATIATWGDDGILALSFPLSLTAYQEVAAQMGMKMTGCDKTERLIAQPLTGGRFLKRAFVRRGHDWVAPLPLDTIRESLLWQFGSTNSYSNMQSTLDNWSIEMAYHQDCFSDYVTVFQAASKLGLTVPVSETFLLTLREGYDNTYGMALYLRLLRVLWNTFASVDSIPLESLPPPPYELSCLDLATKAPLLPEGVFYHVGISTPHGEMTFGQEGPLLVKTSYTPTFTIPLHFRLSPLSFSKFLASYPKYHLVTNNCATWCCALLRMAGVRVEDFSLRARNWCELNQPALVQGDTAGSSTLSTEVAAPNCPPVSPTFPTHWTRQQVGPTRTVRETVETAEVLCSGEWNQNQDVNHQLAVCNLPEDLYAIKQIADKLRFNALIRGKLVIQLKVASNPFMIGSLVLVWIPQAKLGFAADVDLHVLSFTAMPHLKYNAAQSNECELQIPFIHTQNFIGISSSSLEDTMGSLYVRVLNPLVSTEATQTATFRVFVHFTDIQTEAPTPIQRDSRWTASEGSFLPSYSAQGDEAEEKSKQGLLAGISDLTGAAASLVSGIPVIGNAVSGLASFVPGVSAVARALGFSKPNSEAATAPMIPRPFTSVSHHEGLDMSIPLSTHPKNRVSILPQVFGTSIDEMNFRYICSTPMCIGTVVWSTSQVPDTTLLSIPITPFLGGKFTFNYADAEHVATQLTPMGFVALAFEYWRGDINIQLEVIGTSYHRGQLLAYYTPRGGNVYKSGPPRLTECPNMILNLSDTNILNCKCDFVSPRPYQKLGDIFTTTIDGDYSVGSFHVKVLNALNNSAAAPTKVYINIWISGGKGIKFQLPTLRRISQLSYGYKAPTSLELLFESFCFQGDEQTSHNRADSTQLESDYPSFHFMKTEDLSFSELVMGEEVNSLRDLLKISTLKFITTCPYSSVAQIYNVPVHRFIKPGTDQQLVDTYYDHMMRLYRYSRGSMRHKLSFQNSSCHVSVALRVGAFTEGSWVATSDPLEGAPWAAALPKLNPSLEYSIPFYSNKKSIVHGSQNDDRYVSILVRPLSTRDSLRFTCFESIGDDFSAGYLMGPPAVYLKIVVDLVAILQKTYTEGSPASTIGYYYPQYAKPSSVAKFSNTPVPFSQRAYAPLSADACFIRKCDASDAISKPIVSLTNQTPWNIGNSQYSFFFPRYFDELADKTGCIWDYEGIASEHSVFGGAWLVLVGGQVKGSYTLHFPTTQATNFTTLKTFEQSGFSNQYANALRRAGIVGSGDLEVKF